MIQRKGRHLILTEKYKAKRIDSGSWVYGNLLYKINGNKTTCLIISNFIDEDGKIRITEGYDVDPSTVCRYVNRSDKNGRELYENDMCAQSVIGQVIWDGDGLIVDRVIGQLTDNNLVLIKKGKVKLLKPNTCMDDGTGFCDLYLDSYDGQFYEWDDIEYVGNAFDQNLIL